MKKRCFIFGAGEETELALLPAENDIVIAADGGEDYARKMGITPTLFIGDLDSAACSPKTSEKIILPTEKDDTDTNYALKHALQNGCKEIFIYGGTGKRLDHTFANIATAAYAAENGAVAYLIGNGYALTVIRNGKISFDKDFFGTVSVFAYGGSANGVTEKGLKYEVENAVISPNFPIGVSNELVGKTAEIEVKSGYLAVIWQLCGEKIPLVI